MLLPLFQNLTYGVTSLWCSETPWVDLNIFTQMFTYKSSITASWNPSGRVETTVAVPTGRNIRYNTVKLEQLNYYYEGSTKCVNLGPLFVVCPDITPLAVDILSNGTERNIIGGAQFFSAGESFGNYFVSNEVSPYKATTTGTDNLRGDFRIQVLDYKGDILEQPSDTRFTITVSFWEVVNSFNVSNKD